METDDNDITTYGAGETLFHEGDPGGDLFFILDGTVKIFKEVDEREVLLSILGKGDIIGVMTVLTQATRSAHAKAETAVKARMVSSKQFKTLMATVPVWMRAMFKDLTDKIIKTNAKVMDLDNRARSLEALVPSMLKLGLQLADGIKILGELLAKDEAGVKWIATDDLKSRLRILLKAKPDDFEQAFEVLELVGFQRLPNRLSDAKKLALADIETMAMLPEYVTKLRRNPKGRRELESLQPKERKTLFDLIEYAKFLKMAPSSEAKIECSAATGSFEKMFQRPLVRTALDKGAQAGLLRLEKSGAEFIMFTPERLLRDLIFLEIFKKLNLKDQRLKVAA